MDAPPTSPPKRITRARAKVLEGSKQPAAKISTPLPLATRTTSRNTSKQIENNAEVASSRRNPRINTRKQPTIIKSARAQSSKPKVNSQHDGNTQSHKEDGGPRTGSRKTTLVQTDRGLTNSSQRINPWPTAYVTTDSHQTTKSAARNGSISSKKGKLRSTTSKETIEQEKENIVISSADVEHPKAVVEAAPVRNSVRSMVNSSKALRRTPLSPRKVRQPESIVPASSESQVKLKPNEARARTAVEEEPSLKQGCSEAREESAGRNAISNNTVTLIENQSTLKSVKNDVERESELSRPATSNETDQYTTTRDLIAETSGLTKSPQRFAKIPALSTSLERPIGESNGLLRSPPKKPPSAEKAFPVNGNWNKSTFSPAGSLFQSPARRPPPLSPMHGRMKASNHVITPSLGDIGFDCSAKLRGSPKRITTSPLKKTVSQPADPGNQSEYRAGDSLELDERSARFEDELTPFPSPVHQSQLHYGGSPTIRKEKKVAVAGDCSNMYPSSFHTTELHSHVDPFLGARLSQSPLMRSDDDSEDELAYLGTMYQTFRPSEKSFKSEHVDVDLVENALIASASAQKGINFLSRQFETRSPMESLPPLDCSEGLIGVETLSNSYTVLGEGPSIAGVVSNDVPLEWCHEHNKGTESLEFDLLKHKETSFTGTETCTPAKVFKYQTQHIHTVSKVPLRPEGTSTGEMPLAKDRKIRSKSLSMELSPQADLELQALRQIYPANDGKALQETQPTTPTGKISQTEVQGYNLLDGVPVAGGFDVSHCIATPWRTPGKQLNARLLAGTIVFVDVHTSDGADANGVFTDLLMQMGAKCVKQWSWNPWTNKDSMTPNWTSESSKPAITHVVFKDGSRRTMEKVREAKGVVLCVGVGWVLDCERNNQWMDEDMYAVDVQATLQSSRRHRRKSMEPKMLSHKSSAMTTNSSQCTPYQGGQAASPEKSVEADYVCRQSRSPSAPGVSEMRRTSVAGQQLSTTSLPSCDGATPRGGSLFIDFEDGEGSPATPYFLHHTELVQKTCPPKDRTMYFPVSGNIAEIQDTVMRDRLVAARRKSLQFVPKVGSPLAKSN